MSYSGEMGRNGSSLGLQPIASIDQRSGEADHRIANSFSLLAGAVSNHARQLAKQQGLMTSSEVSQILSEVSSRIAAVGQLHRELATRPDAMHIDLNEHLWNLCDALIGALAPHGQFTLIPAATASCAIKADKVLPVCLIVTEVVTNALKYAHPTGVRGSLMLGCRYDDDGSVLIEVADDGVGLPDGFDPVASGGIGSRTVSLLARKLEAEIAYLPQPIGLCFQLRLPPSAV